MIPNATDQRMLLFSRMDEAADAIDDSEDEVDYTKMDQGNKKGPIGLLISECCYISGWMKRLML